MANFRIAAASGKAGTVTQGETPVVIDNLRASSTIVTALSLGVLEVHPVQEDRNAFDLKKQGAVIAGEAGGVKLAGYDLGNSPTELAAFIKKSPFKTLALKTTNLIPFLLTLPRAIVCSSLNVSAVSEFIKNKDVVIFALGGANGASEDVGIGFVLASAAAGVSYDGALVSSLTRESGAARNLQRIGYQADVNFIADQTARFDVIPYFDGKIIRKWAAGHE